MKLRLRGAKRFFILRLSRWRHSLTNEWFSLIDCPRDKCLQILQTCLLGASWRVMLHWFFSAFIHDFRIKRISFFYFAFLNRNIYKMTSRWQNTSTSYIAKNTITMHSELYKITCSYKITLLIIRHRWYFRNTFRKKVHINSKNVSTCVKKFGQTQTLRFLRGWVWLIFHDVNINIAQMKNFPL